MSFVQLLNDKVNAAGKTLAEIAESIQVSLPSLRGALKGRSLPNKRSMAKYATFLALGEDECAALVKEAKAGAPATGGGKAKGKRGRKAKSGPKARSGPKPKGGKGGRKAKGSPLSASLADIADAITRAEAVLADGLVMRLYALSGAKRKAAEAILASVL